MTTWLGSTKPEEALLILQKMGKGNPQSLKDEMKKVPCLSSELLLRHESMRGDLLGSEKGVQRLMWAAVYLVCNSSDCFLPIISHFPMLAGVLIS